ncbi:MAG TPA: CAP domain-containing protein [Patescibacteria group bacterium]|nr:CAP domain-containing protein [Patescibacteria group bacterium]
MFTKLKFGILLGAILLSTGLARPFSSLSMNQIMSMVNADRVSQGLPRLDLDPTLNLAALAKADDMITNHYFAHTSPDGVAPWYWIKNVGYNYSYAGENLALGFQDASDLMNSWMNSPDHRANILSPNYQDMGLAVIQSSDSTLVVQMFGSVNHLSLNK